MRRSEWGHAPLREPSGNASKGGGAANGAERRAEPRLTKGERTRGSLSLIVAHVGCSSRRKRHQLSLQKGSISLALSLKRLSLSPWVSFFLVQRSLPPRSFPRSWPGAVCWWRRGREAPQCGLWWTCASGRGVPERVRRPRGRPEPGATKLTVGGERDSTAAEGRSFPVIFVCMLWRLVRQVKLFKCAINNCLLFGFNSAFVSLL